MGFSQENGYIPVSIETMMLSVMENVNTQFGLEYTAETFIGTNFYKYFYALIQRLQENEIKTSEIFLNLQQYFEITNEKISNPVVTAPGLIEVLEDAGYIASVKPPEDADAGKVYVCVDKQLDDIEILWEDSDDYLVDKLAVCTILKDSTIAGVITQGSEAESITLTNGQSFDFKYSLPNRIPVHLRLTITLSENNLVEVGNPDDVKEQLLFNVREKYKQGKNFEPQTYWQVSDSPWASQVLLEWSDDDEMTYYTDIYDSAFDDIFDVKLERIHLVEI